MTQSLPSPPHAATRGASTHVVHSLFHFVRLLRRRKSVMFISLGVALALGAAHYLTATRRYRAEARLLVAPTGVDSTNVAVDGQKQTLMPTYERLFSSARVLDQAAAGLTEPPPELGGVPRSKWAAALRANLSTNTLRHTNLIDIGYTSRDAEAASRVVSAVVAAYVEFIKSSHRKTASDILKDLVAKEEEIEKKLADKKQELIREQQAAGHLGLTQDARVVHPVVQSVANLSEALLEVQKKRIQLESSLAAIESAIRSRGDLRHHLLALEPHVGREMILTALGLNTRDAETLAAIERRLLENRARLRVVAAHYGPLHHEYRNLAESIENDERFLSGHQSRAEARLAKLQDGQLGSMLVGMVREALSKARQHEHALNLRYEEAKLAAQQLNSHAVKLTLIGDDVKHLTQQRLALANRIANLDINQNQASVRVEVVSNPTPPDTPVSPKLALTGLLSLLGGLLVGGITIYALDVLDDRFRSPEELQDQLGLPLLAMVRRLEQKDETGAAAVHAHTDPQSVQAEAFRTLRTALAFGDSEARRYAITSTEPGDGKTTVAANLAAAMARAGGRTLMIDGDLRRPGLTNLFALRGAGGLSDVLRSDGDIAAACEPHIAPTGIERLDVLPCGPRPQDPTELLSGPRLGDVLAWAESRYDHVLVDSPPVLAASDAAVIGRAVDGLILVVQPEKNHRRKVLRAVENLRTLGVSPAGCVVNRTAADSQADYSYESGYGYGYGYGYADGYGEPEDSSAAAESSLAASPAPEEPHRSTTPDANAPPASDQSRSDPTNEVIPHRAA